MYGAFCFHKKTFNKVKQLLLVNQRKLLGKVWFYAFHWRLRKSMVALVIKVWMGTFKISQGHIQVIRVKVNVKVKGTVSGSVENLLLSLQQVFLSLNHLVWENSFRTWLYYCQKNKKG